MAGRARREQRRHQRRAVGGAATSQQAALLDHNRSQATPALNTTKLMAYI
jgi:hypothetical protein